MLATSMQQGGADQVTYAGHPLYYFKGDTSPGATTGQGITNFGGRWWLVAPSGTPITATVQAAKPAASPSSKGSGGGWG
jgi:hypothetical protein